MRQRYPAEVGPGGKRSGHRCRSRLHLEGQEAPHLALILGDKGHALRHQVRQILAAQVHVEIAAPRSRRSIAASRSEVANPTGTGLGGLDSVDAISRSANDLAAAVHLLVVLAELARRDRFPPPPVIHVPAPPWRAQLPHRCSPAPSQAAGSCPRSTHSAGRVPCGLPRVGSGSGLPSSSSKISTMARLVISCPVPTL